MSSRDVIEFLNLSGNLYLQFATAMAVQFGILFLVFVILDALWLRRIPAAIRYGVWSLLLVKLMLPVWLAGPITATGFLDRFPHSSNNSKPPVVTNNAADSRFPGRKLAVVTNVQPVIEAPVAIKVQDVTKIDAVPIGQSSQSMVAVEQSLSLDWKGIFLCCWVGGVIGLTYYFFCRVRLVRKLCESSVPVNEEMQSLLRDCQARLGLERRMVLLRLSDEISTPAICGLWRPTILLPSSLIQRLDREQLELVLIHELHHWRRFDLHVNCLQSILMIAYFYNPLVWLMNLILRRIREQAVDEAVLATVQSSSQKYSLMLLDIMEFARRTPAFTVRMIGVVESHKAITQRIQRIISCPVSPSSRISWHGLILILFVAVIGLPLSGRNTQTIAQELAEPAKKTAEKKPAKEAEKPQEKTIPNAEPAVKAFDNVAPNELVGTVLDSDGKPIAGVTVDVWSFDPGNETTTDEHGRFRVPGLEPKKNVEVLISKAGYSPEHFAQRPCGVKNWIIKLGNQTYFEGKMIGSDNKPVTNTAIRASFGPVQCDGFTVGEITTEGKSNEDGSYRLYVKPGIYDIKISAGQQGVFRQSGMLISPDEAKELNVQLKAGVRFEARVIDSITSQPVEGFILWQPEASKLFGRSNRDGLIAFEGLIPGKSEFICGGGEEIVHESGMRYYEHGPYGRWWSPDSPNEWMRFQIDDESTNWQRNFDDLGFELSVGMKPVTIVVEQGVRIRGRVTDPEGKPVEAATVAPARTGSGNSLTGDTRYSVRTKSDGSYEVVLPASNKSAYNLVVHDGDYSEWRKWANGVSEPMQTTPGQKIEGLDLRLTKPATIKGRVTVGGKPAKDLDVRTHDFTKRENRYYDPTTKTKVDGTFELKFVRPGKHYLQVEPFWLSAGDAPSKSTQIVEVKAGELLEGIELVSQPQQRQLPEEITKLPFKARLLDSQRKPISGALAGLGTNGGVMGLTGTYFVDKLPEVPVSDPNGEIELDTSLLRRMRSNSAMIYAVDREHRRAGFAILDMQQHLSASTDSPITIDVVLEPAERVNIQFDTTAFKPHLEEVPGFLLQINKEGLLLQQAYLKEPGKFELWLPAGEYDLTGVSPQFSNSSTLNFTVTKGQQAKPIVVAIQPSRMVSLFGKPAPEFEQLKPSDTNPSLKLADLKGKVVVLDFWGHWCGPCVAGMPELMAMYDEFHDKGVEFVAIHDDSLRSMNELQKIMNNLKDKSWGGRAIPFNVILDGGGRTSIPNSEQQASGATTATYGITVFPTTILIDREGRVHGLANTYEKDSFKQQLHSLLESK